MPASTNRYSDGHTQADTAAMKKKITDTIVKNLPVPKAGNRITYDGDENICVKGFGVRVTSAGSRASVLAIGTQVGRERRYTIGLFPDWSTVRGQGRAKA